MSGEDEEEEEDSGVEKDEPMSGKLFVCLYLSVIYFLCEPFLYISRLHASLK